MNRSIVPNSLFRPFCFGVAAVAVCVTSSPVWALDGIVRVEEDWVLDIGQPDPTGDAPQIINAFSSTDQLADVHALFELNHRTLPDYQVGGMNLQCWSGKLNLDYHSGPHLQALSNANEHITYTMSMKLDGGNVAFEVLNGNSATWGSFGGQGYLKCIVSTPQTSLSLYSPNVSVDNSRVSYAAHRVKKFALKEVRYYSATGLVQTDTTERVVHQLPAN